MRSAYDPEPELTTLCVSAAHSLELKPQPSVSSRLNPKQAPTDPALYPKQKNAVWMAGLAEQSAQKRIVRSGHP